MTIADEIFERWAPAGARWSDWAKPVPFAHVSGEPGTPQPAPFPVPGVPPADGATLIVVDLPGATSVAFGVALAAIGYQPVPLFNAVPGPRGGEAAVDVWPIVDALRDAALPPPRIGAPPAFLLDAGRRIAHSPPASGTFDNRSLVLPTDFPSATLLRSRGIGRAILLHAPADVRPQDDLAHVLLRWQDGGLAIDMLDPWATPPVPRAIVVPRPRWYRAMCYAAIARLRFRPHPLGGFGGVLPMPSSG